MDGDWPVLRGVQDTTEFLKQLDEVIAAGSPTTSGPSPCQPISTAHPPAILRCSPMSRPKTVWARRCCSRTRKLVMIDPAVRTQRKLLERHHLFPRAWLEREGINDRRLVNQMANYALLEWPENLTSATSPLPNTCRHQTAFLSRRMGTDARTACLAGRLAGDGLRRFFGATPSSHGRHYPARLRELEVT